MPLIQYCPNCWAEHLIDATVCERCTTSLSETAAMFYDQKLMRALHHPVPETREMAAMLLGQTAQILMLERRSVSIGDFVPIIPGRLEFWNMSASVTV